jgi:membrane protease YdiL (CAAX protease family)
MFFNKPVLPATGDKGSVHWGPWQSIFITISIFIVAQLAGLALVYTFVAGSGNGTDGVTDGSSPLTQFGLVGVIDVITIGLIVWLLRIKRTAGWAIGWRRPRWEDAWYVLAGFGVYVLLFYVATFVVAALVPGFDPNQQQDVGFSTSTSGVMLLPIFVSLVVLTPITEELLMRGVLYSGLRVKLSIAWAMLITSMLFASAHLPGSKDGALLWIGALDTFLLSLVLVYMREKTGRLWASIGLHMLKNMVAFLTLFVFHVQ